jgi:hypothetical protein
VRVVVDGEITISKFQIPNEQIPINKFQIPK